MFDQNIILKEMKIPEIIKGFQAAGFIAKRGNPGAIKVYVPDHPERSLMIPTYQPFTKVHLNAYIRDIQGYTSDENWAAPTD